MDISLDVLNKFESISLKEMDGVKLMNRTDVKFTFNRLQFDLVLGEIMKEYRILEVDGKRISRYKTLYYDTDTFTLYNKHHNGELNRYKIRHRTYLESNLGFLEVKFKNNKGRTIKTRIKKPTVPVNWKGESGVFLTKMLPFDPHQLIPVIWINYSRITLVHKTRPERLTIDLKLEFVRGTVIKELYNVVIAEVKQEKRSASIFLKIMRKYHIRQGSISKYCMGIALTIDEVKKNNFKAKLLVLDRIISGTNLYSNKQAEKF